jgi:hypothetical protein
MFLTTSYLFSLMTMRESWPDLLTFMVDVAAGYKYRQMDSLRDKSTE